MKSFCMLSEVRTKKTKTKSKNRQISSFGFHCVAKNIKG